MEQLSDPQTLIKINLLHVIKSGIFIYFIIIQEPIKKIINFVI